MASNVCVVSLEDLCLLTVSCYLSPSNVWSIHRLVPYVHCPRVKHIVHSYICDNFMDISHTAQFLALDEKEMEWLLDNQDIKVSEAAMLDSLTRWYKHSQRQRENEFKQLFEKLHLSVIGKEVLSEIIKKYNITKVIPELRKYKKFLPQLVSLEELIYQENKSKITLISMPAEYVKNRSFKYLPCQGAAINYWMPFTTNEIDITLNEVGDDKYATYIFSHREKLYIYGSTERAENDGTREDVFICIDLRTKSVKHCCVSPEELPAKGLSVVCGIYVFIIGGQKGIIHNPNVVQPHGLGHTVYRYDFVKDAWTKMRPTLFGHSRNSLYAVELALSYKDRFVYIFGKHCERYDLLTNIWAPIVVHDSFRRGICCSSAHVDNNGNIFLFAIPKDMPILRCFVFDAVKSVWKEPFKQVSYCQITNVFFGKALDVSKTLLGQGALGERCRIKYKISEVEITDDGGENSKLRLCNEHVFISALGYVAFDTVMVSRGTSFKLEQPMKI